MSSLDEANNFVNCIMNRYKSDTIMRGTATILLVLMPFIAVFLGNMIVGYRNHDDEILTYLNVVAGMMFYFILLIMMYLTYRRLQDHSNRDSEWRDILIHYAFERGRPIRELRRLDAECRIREGNTRMIPASILLVVYFVLFVLTVCYPKVLFYQSGMRISPGVVTAFGFIFTFLMFFLVYTYNVRYPFAHESSQIGFIIGFRQVMKFDNMDVPVMMPSVKHTWQIVHIFLFVMTFGLYTFYLLYKVYRDTNNHLYNQWSYEIRLMDAIVRHEGGTGIMAVKETGEEVE